jgi:hypothetical protein
MKRQLFAAFFLTVAGLGGIGAGGHTVALASNADAAHACQAGGYANLMGSNGTRFANAGACVAYVANGGTIQGIPLCAPTATSGCVIFDNTGLSLINSNGTVNTNVTLTLTGAFSFSPLTDCGYPCGGSVTGAGTYNISGSSPTSGTFTLTGIEDAYFLTSGANPTDCASASEQQFYVDVTLTSSTGTQTQYLLDITNFDGVILESTTGGALYAGGFSGLNIEC